MIDDIKNLKKVLFHIHLDGAVSLEIASKISGLDIDDLKVKMIAPYKGKSLGEYLTKFDFPISLMQSKENLYEVAKDLVMRLLSYNVVYAEVRFCPLFHTREGLSLDDVIRSVLEGLNSNNNIRVNLILCMMRHFNDSDNKLIIDMAYKYKDLGVCAIDLAGDEKLKSVNEFEKLFDYAKSLGLNYTIHAGEVTDCNEVIDAISLGTKRVGHGVKISDSVRAIDCVKDRDILLEVCPTSNINTDAFDIYSEHPIKYLYDKGIKINISTDNDTVSDINLNEEYIRLYNAFKFSVDDFKKMNRDSIDYAFISEEEKEKYKRILD